MTTQQTDEKIVVIYDTYCGWCYGAGPVFDALVDSDANVEVLHRHLFEGDAAPKMSEGKGAQILQLIPQVEGLTGQKFSDAFKTNVAGSDTEVLRSGLSAQAAALVHAQGAEKEFAVRKRLETLHFGEGLSSTDRAAIIEALIAEGVAPEEADKIGTPELEAQAAEYSAEAKALMAAVGSRGVPTVLKVKGDTITPINHQAFYGRPETVADKISTITDI